MTLQIRPSTRVEALSDANLSRLATYLAACGASGAMPLEEVDGFFAALIAGPVRTSPHEHWRTVFGTEMKALSGEARAQLDEMLDLLVLHWHAIEDTLAQGLLLGPLLQEDERGAVRGQAWARGFLRGMHLHRDRWRELVEDRTRGAALEPMLELSRDDGTCANALPTGTQKSRRADLLTDATLAVAFLFRHFRPSLPAATAAAGTRSLH